MILISTTGCCKYRKSNRFEQRIGEAIFILIDMLVNLFHEI
jgi:hypothetical protein